MVNTQWPWRDGLQIKIFQNKLWMFGGWNPFPGIFDPGPSTNEVWHSEDGGLNWNFWSNAPWTPRHSFGCEIIGETLYIFGSDIFTDDKIYNDMWAFDGEEFTQLTDDTGPLGLRLLSGSCVFNGHIIMGGGQTAVSGPFEMFTDICRFNFETLKWENVGQLPIDYASTTVFLPFNESIYILGGGEYTGGTPTNLNNYLFKSNGSDLNTWTTVMMLPEKIDGLMYMTGHIMRSHIFLLNGTSDNNKVGLWHFNLTDNSQNWVELNGQYPATHASSMSVNDTDNILYIVSGNSTNTVAKINHEEI